MDFQIYCDMLATRIGCNPPLLELFCKKPSMWLKIMFGPFTMHQYRYQSTRLRDLYPYPYPISYSLLSCAHHCTAHHEYSLRTTYIT